jgi:hypothetical protein
MIIFCVSLTALIALVIFAVVGAHNDIKSGNNNHCGGFW